MFIMKSLIPQKRLLLPLVLLMMLTSVNAQVLVEGYAYESGNRGYLNQVVLQLLDAATEDRIATALSDPDGKFTFENVDADKTFIIVANKDLFHEQRVEVSTAGGEKQFVKLEMKRAPGYLFDVTLAEKRDSGQYSADAIKGALIEVFNNTKEKEELVLKDHQYPEFRLNMLKGNHYTILIRKKGYLAKRMEAFVDVKGCILCFEGVGQVQPGVSDNLTEGNAMGTLLANVELERVYNGKKISLKNIYYDFGKHTLRRDAKAELDKVSQFLRDNPEITVELGSHTDVRGASDKNLALSDRRAESAMGYLINEGDINPKRIFSRGYGESQIKNKCKSGVTCTEAEHGVNRRTELKVLEYRPPAEFRPLKRIIEDENMGSILAELENEGQIRVDENGEIPDDLKKLIGKDDNTKKSNDANNEAKTQKEKAKEQIEEDVKQKAVIKTTEKSKTEMVKEAKSAGNVDPMSNMNDKIFMEREIDHSGNRILKNYSGYKILLHQSSETITKDHMIIKDHGQGLVEYKTHEDELLYLIGDFKSSEQAKAFYQSAVSEKYPKASLIRFVEGVRVL